ncbi:XdhC family protein [Lacicoccus alkaliphilus]|uniref:Xanthine and CO dehydrogenase maturation factor, XdhC/CoxF family n=1 Tax=Lacicoccus alkaliphilus DSM 16010 TaxID=1123231 RepID=A0A1M7H3T9_9BACL|nr:XdhC family protein [Salinicoccus alkaliphilus]SHM23016.1 Xanthine and CO dehydrogenase maturation factor, XdhC/CoxF family [Salinicoccus alkaliphilus DSM 16010]
MHNDTAYDSWLESIQRNEACGLATVLHGEDAQSFEPARVFLNEDGASVNTIEDPALTEGIRSRIAEKLGNKNAKGETVKIALKEGGVASVFIDIHHPPVHVMIFGAGHDAVPVAKYSVSLGFDTTVVDAREAFNCEDNFPGTERIIVQPDHYRKHVTITKNTFVIVMNHHMEKDSKSLAFALRSGAPYVGVLGPRSRREKMMAQLHEEGVSFSVAELSRMHNPIGLDIGAESSEEIAISILSEIIALSKGHRGGFLHDKHSIHKYPSQNGIPVRN